MLEEFFFEITQNTPGQTPEKGGEELKRKIYRCL
jgi:hypothetical protein